MIEGVLVFLIQLAILCLLVYIVLFVLQALGIPLPGRVVQIIWIIVALVALLMLLRFVVPGIVPRFLY